MYTLSDWERREIERLNKHEEDEPEFVTRRKLEMIALIKEGKILYLLSQFGRDQRSKEA